MVEKIGVDEHHEIFGGRKRRDFRFWNNEYAVEIRERMNGLNNEKGLNSSEIAELINEGQSSLSLAAGGRIGDRRLKEIVDKLYRV